MKRKFWNWVRNEADGERTLVLNGEISDETWYGDEVTPALFQKELDAGTGDFDTESLEMKEAEMFVEGYKAVLVKDTSFKGLWKVSFTLKEF